MFRQVLHQLCFRQHFAIANNPLDRCYPQLPVSAAEAMLFVMLDYHVAVFRLLICLFHVPMVISVRTSKVYGFVNGFCWDLESFVIIFF